MNKLDIEFSGSSTGMYSSWHLNIARELNFPLMVTSDMGQFVKIGNDVYKLRSNDYYKLHQYFVMLEEMNDKGEITDEEVLREVDDIVNNRNKDFFLEKCQPLDKFRKELENMIERRNGAKG